MRIAIITVSDRAARGEREDLTGPGLKELVERAGGEVIGLEIVPDERVEISALLKRICDGGQADIVLTNGGTGLGPRDVTPEATAKVIERSAPGLTEAMRALTRPLTAQAMLSRAVAGVRGRTLIVNLPGSPQGARECLEVVLPVLPHAVEMLRGKGHAC